MKTSTVVMLGVAVALAIGLSSTLVYANMWSQYNYGQNPQYPGYGPGMMGGYQGYQSFAGGMMGANSGYPAGMMGQGFAGRGTMGGYGGMIGGYGGMMGSGMMSGGTMPAQCTEYMQKYGYNNGWNYSSSKSPTVGIVNYAFYPANLTITRGTTVTWVNMDSVVHTVESGTHEAPTGLFDSDSLQHMQSFSYTFDIPGTYVYHCDPHPYMIGTITVTE